MEERFKIIRHPSGAVTFSGIDMGAIGEVLAENGKNIAIKFPSCSCWAGRGLDRAHVPPRILVLNKNEDGWAYRLIEWENTRKPKTK